MLNPTRDPCVPSSDSPPGSPVLSAHPKARAFTAHHMPCGFPIRGRDPGFPGQGISCSRGGGREEEREGHSRSAFSAFLAPAPASCLSLSLPGALAQCHAVLAWQGSVLLGVPLGSEVTGDPYHASPTHCTLSQR